MQLFCDELADSFDVPVGIAAIEMLETLGHEVVILQHLESDRSALSRGFIRHSRELAGKNTEHLKNVITADEPLRASSPRPSSPSVMSK